MAKPAKIYIVTAQLFVSATSKPKAEAAVQEALGRADAVLDTKITVEREAK